jgi:hypothetical protein
VLLTTYAHLVPWLEMSEAIFLPPPPLIHLHDVDNSNFIISSVYPSDIFHTSFVQSEIFTNGSKIYCSTLVGVCACRERKKPKFLCIQFSELLCI